MSEIIKCITCNSNAEKIGNIPSTHIFAGRFVDEVLWGGSLYKCKSCELGFRYPRLTKCQLDKLYVSGSDVAWSKNENLRIDWSLGIDWILNDLEKGSTILDVGCFDGRFLGQLAHQYKCFGIEIHPIASLSAASRGIEVIGSDFSKVSGKFDCITAFDVIEHVENPKIFLSQIYDALNPGGICLISTGNFDSPTFRFMKGSYWYCTIAEHISFLSPSWFKKPQNINGFDTVKIHFFSLLKAHLKQRLVEAFLNILYRISPLAIVFLKSITSRKTDYIKYPAMKRVAPPWGSAKDHFIILLRKP